MKENETKEKKTRKPRTVSIENIDVKRLTLTQKLVLHKELEAAIAEDKKNLEAQLSLINGKL